MLAAAAGVLGSVNATTAWRGTVAASSAISKPYPYDWPDCDSATQVGVS